MQSLRKKREEMGLTMSQLSKMTGISSNFISEIELGRHTCSFKTLEKLVMTLSQYRPMASRTPVTATRTRSR